MAEPKEPLKKTFICYYAQDHPGFRLPELHSVCSCTNTNVEFGSNTQVYHNEKPYLEIKAFDESIQAIAGRSILIRYCIELWAHGCCLEEILNEKNTLASWTKQHFTNESITFKIDVEAFGKKLSIDKKREWIDSLGDILDIPGKVKLNDPSHTLCLLLDFHSSNAESEGCKYIYFGRLVARGQRELLHKFSLKTRYFIGNTSMDPQLSFLMANQGKVQRGSFVFDPFVGTGSILSCCAQFGACTAGSDIDKAIIYGRARDEIIRTNYKQYSLVDKYVDVMAADITNFPMRTCEFFDAVITDPPYGIREGGRKLNSNDGCIDDESKDDVKSCVFPSSSLHQLSDIILDLIHFAAIYLRAGGRLVYWLPVFAPSYDAKLVPSHPCFTVISNTEQKLTSVISRRLITMEKTSSLKITDLKPLKEGNEEWKRAHNQFRDNYFKGKSEKHS
eukprot:gene8623-14635_t